MMELARKEIRLGGFEQGCPGVLSTEDSVKANEQGAERTIPYDEGAVRLKVFGFRARAGLAVA